MSDNTIKSDVVDLSANTVTRSGDPGRTLFSDRFPGGVTGPPLPEPTEIETAFANYRKALAIAKVQAEQLAKP